MAEAKKLRKRSETDSRYKWNVEAMYRDDEAWEADFQAVREQSSEVTSFAGRLGESADTLFAALQANDALWQKAERVYVYAQMRSDEDTGNTFYQELNRRSEMLFAELASATSFIDPEIMTIPDGKIDEFLREHEALKQYDYMLRNMLRRKQHVLSKEAEAMMAQFSEIAGAPKQIFSMINNADMKFGSIIDEEGDSVELTHGNYIAMMESRDRRVRKDAYERLYSTYRKQLNTIAAAYYYNVKKNVVLARMRNYPSALAAALDGGNIPESVYMNLIDAVGGKLDAMHRYVEIRKKLLGLDEIRMYDMYARLADMPEVSVPYEEALEKVRAALKPMGQQYIDDLNAGLEAGWVDVCQNEGKRSGAYSFGSYDSMPYVLLNYNDKFKDAFTVIHELGHSMNSFYTRRKQPFTYGGHSIFTAEVASTVNECLLMQDLLKKCSDKTERLYLLTIYLEEFRGTVFRQTMFAEFELEAHRAVERGEVLTADRLCSIYGELNRKYFGEGVEYDDFIPAEWARIPHFYNAFYVYQYATGYSAAVAISNKILTEGAEARDAYLEFLAAGDSDYPIELLRGAGVDMSRPDVVNSALDTFAELVEELEKIAEEIQK